MELKCENCCYWWKEETDERECCHWECRAPADLPPCEEEEREIELKSWED